MKKRVLFLFVICASLALLSSVAFAQTSQDSVVIHPLYWDDSQTVYSNQEIIFVMGWAACRKGLVQDYLTAVNFIFTLDGQPLFGSKSETNQFWGPVTQIPAPAGADACVGKTPETIWRAGWEYSPGELPAGDHPVYFANRLDHPVVDGGDYDGDGSPDLFYGITNEREFTIHVEDPAGE